MLPHQRADKDPLFKAGTKEHWASIPLKVHTHSYNTHALTHTHTGSRFDQVQLHSGAQCNYLWRSTHAFALHSGIFIYIYKRRVRWGDASDTGTYRTVHKDGFCGESAANTRGGRSNGSTWRTDSTSQQTEASKLTGWVKIANETQWKLNIMSVMISTCTMSIEMWEESLTVDQSSAVDVSMFHWPPGCPFIICRLEIIL